MKEKDLQSLTEKNRESGTFGRADIVAAAVIFAVGFLVSLIGIYNGHEWGGDFSQYIAQARALDTGDISGWLEKNTFIVENSHEALAATVYPWLMPLMLMPVYHFFGLDYIPYQIFQSVIFAAAATLLWVFMRRRRIGRLPAAAMIAAVVANREYLMLTKNIISDLLCYLIVVLAWVAIDAYLEKRKPGRALFAGICCSLACLTRTMALALFVALFAADFFYIAGRIRNREKMHLKELLTCGIPYVSFLLINSFMGMVLPKSGGTYSTFFSLEPAGRLSNVFYYVNQFKLFIFQGRQGMYGRGVYVMLLIFVPLLVMALIGTAERLMKADWLLFYAGATMGMLIIYKYQAGTRFLLSIFPIILMMIFYGLELLCKKAGEKHPKLKLLYILPALICLLCMVNGTLYLTDLIREPLTDEVSSPEAMELYGYINKELSEEDVVFTWKPRVLYLYTGVYAYAEFVEDSEEIFDRADYVLQCNTSLPGWRDKLGALMNKDPERYEQVFSNKDFELYRIRR